MRLTSFLGRNENVGRVLLLFPAVAYLSFLLFYPLIRFFALSVKPYFSLMNYYHFFKTPVYTEVLLRTFFISGEVTLFCFILGYPVACLLAKVSTGKRNILLIFILLPYWTSILVRSFSWMIVLGAKGVVNNLLTSLGLVSAPVQMMYTNFAVVVGMVQVLLPFMILPIFSVAVNMDRSLIKASLNLGADPFRTFRKVFFPLTMSGVWSGSLLVFIIALGFFITPSLLGGRKSVMLSMLIDQQAEYILNLNFAATISVILMIATIIVLVFFNRFIGMKKMISGSL